VRQPALVPLDVGWDDSAPGRSSKNARPTMRSNRVHGDVLLQDASNNLVHAIPAVSLLGVDNLVWWRPTRPCWSTTGAHTPGREEGWCSA